LHLPSIPAVVTRHRIHQRDARDMSHLRDGSVDLVVTSPPYPMIAMWDETFSRLNPRVAAALQRENGAEAFEAMHGVLDTVWEEVRRVLRPGGIACINIGDATRRLRDDFRLYPNHARVLSRLSASGFALLPAILWRKPTNAPTKFMGSGMLPAGAYVTLEHETILVARKAGRRDFRAAEERRRRGCSAFFWEERNIWFSDVWMDLRGTGQSLQGAARDRSGAFPFQLPWRLVLMYSLQGDTVLDPFAGTGTTLCAAAATGRNAIGCELEPDLVDAGLERVRANLAAARRETSRRFERHLGFVAKKEAEGKPLRHRSRHYGFPVMTRQEVEMLLLEPVDAAFGDADELRVTCAPAIPGCDPPAPSPEGSGRDERPDPGRQRMWCD
jgi:DNA modification methylase